VEFSHEGQEIIDLERVAKGQRHPSIVDGLEYVDLYDEEIAYVDHEIGRLLDAYKKMGLLDNSLVIFTADHGESMMEHEVWFTHGYHVYEEIIRVPLAFIGPDVPSKRVATPVSLMDLAPTILDAAGVSLVKKKRQRVLGGSPKSWDIYSEATQKKMQWRSVIRGQKKWMVGIDDETGKPSVHRRYDLSVDPKEESPLDWEESDAAGKALLELTSKDPDTGGIPANMRWGSRPNAPKVAPGLDDATMERLKALGYVE
jgi:arylsulfatase